MRPYTLDMAYTVGDPRFTETYDRVRPGLAAYIRDAIRANSGLV